MVVFLMDFTAVVTWCWGVCFIIEAPVSVFHAKLKYSDIFLYLSLYVRVHFAMQMSQIEVSSAFFLGKEDRGPGKERQ